MDNNTEQKFNEIAYILVIVTASIYLYVIVNENTLSNDENDNLVKIARILTVITASYFLLNALYGIKFDKSISQYKQVIASIFVLLGALTRLSIKEDTIEFR